jgi:hypothetical protein
MGMSMAYCENDTPGTERDNFFGSVWVPEEAYNDHWMNADGFGTVRLTRKRATVNNPVVTTGSIDDFEVTQLAEDLVVHENLQNVFNDPDGDSLNYTVICENTNLAFTVIEHVLKVNALATFTGETNVTVVATDGEFETSTEFKVTTNVTGIRPESNYPQILGCYPNPFTDLLNVEINLPSDQSGQVIVRVYNMAGIAVITETIGSTSGGKGTFTIDMGGEPGGYYILEIDAGEATQSIIINKQN